MNDALDLIMRRRSIRKYTDQAVEPEKIECLLKAAMAAPTAMNMQPWEFIVIQDEAILKDIRKALVFGKINAPLAIVVCGNLSVFKRQLTERFWVQDCSAATQNILLAAVDMDLGSVWCGVHPINSFERQLSQILGLPGHVHPLNVIFIGYPAEVKEARTQYQTDRIHYDRYDGNLNVSANKALEHPEI